MVSTLPPAESAQSDAWSAARGQFLSALSPAVAEPLERVMAGGDLTVAEAAHLLAARGRDLFGVVLAADELRRQQAGEVVTYVVNRNINFTNVCIKRCGFCAFSRGHREEQGYFLPVEEIVRRAREAWELGATEVCVQAGLPPKMDGALYWDLCRALKAELPDLHIHGFSPEEVLYGATRSRCSIPVYLAGLKEAGVGSLPGTSAEILDDKVRRKISPGRITTKQWIEVITSAHKLGIPTTSTIMFGHVETLEQRARHLALLRSIQRDTGGFTEFVPLGFVYSEAPMYHKQLVEGIQPGPTGDDVMAMHAVARLMLGKDIPNLQVSWVKEGLKLAQQGLHAGANDLGGTLINESISTAAGASYGQLVRPADFRRIIRDAGRIPAERSTGYRLLKRFEQDPATPDPLDKIDDISRFGSYQQLIQLDTFRYAEHKAKQALPVQPVG